MKSDDYKDGYRDGVRDTLEKVKKSLEKRADKNRGYGYVSGTLYKADVGELVDNIKTRELEM